MAQVLSPPLKPRTSLPPKQQRFIVEYLTCLDATKAYIAAGYKASHSADTAGPALLGKLRAYIEPVAQQHLATRLMSADEIVDNLQRLASTDITDFLTWQGSTLIVKDPKDIPKELRQCIESVTQHETQYAKYLKIKLHSKVAALGMLAKYHNLFKRTIASKGLNVNIHVHQAMPTTKAPIVVNPKDNGHKPLDAPKVAFAFAPGPTNGKGADPQHGGNGHANGKNGQG